MSYYKKLQGEQIKLNGFTPQENYAFTTNEQLTKLLMKPVGRSKNQQKLRQKAIMDVLDTSGRINRPNFTFRNYESVQKSYGSEDYVASERTQATLDRAIVTEQSKLLDITDIVDTKFTDKMLIEAYNDSGFVVERVDEGSPKPVTSSGFNKTIGRVRKAGIGFHFTQEMYMRADENILANKLKGIAIAFQQFFEKYIISHLANGVVNGVNGKGIKNDSLVLNFAKYSNSDLTFDKLVDMGQVTDTENFTPNTMLLNQNTLSVLLKGEKEKDYNNNWKYERSPATQLISTTNGSPLFKSLIDIDKMAVSRFIPDGQVIAYDRETYYTFYNRRSPTSAVGGFDPSTDSQVIGFNTFMAGFFGRQNHAIKGLNATTNLIDSDKFQIGS